VYQAKKFRLYLVGGRIQEKFLSWSTNKLGYLLEGELWDHVGNNIKGKKQVRRPVTRLLEKFRQETIHRKM
jgi:hypothetical protein